jgi:hypothetical protein
VLGDPSLSTIVVDKISSTVSTLSGEAKGPSLIKCHELYKRMKTEKLEEQKVNREKIDEYVKKHCFKHIKFYNMMWDSFSNHPKSICQKVCKGLNIIDEERQIYWNTYSASVDNSIKVARNNAIAAIKLSFFKGKYPCTTLVYGMNPVLTCGMCFRLCPGMWRSEQGKKQDQLGSDHADALRK